MLKTRTGILLLAPAIVLMVALLVLPVGYLIRFSFYLGQTGVQTSGGFTFANYVRLFATDISQATVVTLYLLPALNLKLIPKLNKELRPGTRIVSHAFDMGSAKPIETQNINGRTIYFWTIPITP